MAGIVKDRVVIVTGAGAGLGREYALMLAAEGARVVVNDLGVGVHGENGEAIGAAEQVVREIRAAGGQAVANTDDVADWDAGKRIVDAAVSAFGTLDAVVNNAGIVRDRMFVNATIDEWDAVIRVHLRGHFCVTRHAVDYWRAKLKEGGKVDARIINTSSGAGLQGSVGQSVYAAAKGGIASLTLVQAAELGRYGVTANALAPNARTRMTDTAFGDMMKAHEGQFDKFHPGNMAPLVTWLCSEDAKDITGQVFELKGGHVWLSEGWSDGPGFDKETARLTVREIGEIVPRLVATRSGPKPCYGTAGAVV